MLKITMTGRIGKDAEVKADPKNAEFALIVFSLADTETWKDANGVKQSRTTWVSCMIRVKKENASNRAKYLTKGTGLWISGKPYANSYKDKDGVTINSINIIVNEFEFTTAAATPTASNGNGVHERQDSSAAAAEASATASFADFPANTKFDNEAYSEEKLPF